MLDQHRRYRMRKIVAPLLLASTYFAIQNVYAATAYPLEFDEDRVNATHASVIQMFRAWNTPSEDDNMGYALITPTKDELIEAVDEFKREYPNLNTAGLIVRILTDHERRKSLLPFEHLLHYAHGVYRNFKEAEALLSKLTEEGFLSYEVETIISSFKSDVIQLFEDAISHPDHLNNTREYYRISAKLFYKIKKLDKLSVLHRNILNLWASFCIRLMDTDQIKEILLNIKTSILNDDSVLFQSNMGSLKNALYPLSISHKTSFNANLRTTRRLFMQTCEGILNLCSNYDQDTFTQTFVIQDSILESISPVEIERNLGVSRSGATSLTDSRFIFGIFSYILANHNQGGSQKK